MYDTVVAVVAVSHIIQRIGCQPEKTTLHGGQSRSWSAEQGKENRRKSLAAYPPPPTPHTARSEKINKSRDASTGATQVVGLASVQGYCEIQTPQALLVSNTYRIVII